MEFFGLKVESIRAAYSIMSLGDLDEMVICNTRNPSPGRLGAKLVMMGDRSLTLYPIDHWESNTPVFKSRAAQTRLPKEFLEGE